MNENLYKVTAQVEFKDRKAKIVLRVKAKNEDEAIQKSDYSLAEAYGEDIVDGDFLDCELIA